MVLSSASFVYNMDLNKLIDAHAASEADITVLTQAAKAKDVDVTGFKVDGTRVHGVKHGVEFGDVAFLDCFVIGREFLLQLLDWYEQTDYLDLFEAMAADYERVNVQVYDYEGYVAPIFNKDTYFKANMDMLDPKITAELFPADRRIRTKAHDNAPAKFETGSRVSNTRVSGRLPHQGHRLQLRPRPQRDRRDRRRRQQRHRDAILRHQDRRPRRERHRRPQQRRTRRDRAQGYPRVPAH